MITCVIKFKDKIWLIGGYNDNVGSVNENLFNINFKIIIKELNEKLKILLHFIEKSN